MKKNINNLIILIGLAVLIVGCKETTTGIKFNHQAHLGRGLTCEFCHTQYMTDAKAGLPPMDICANCHSIDTTKPSEKCLLCHTHPKQKVKPVLPIIYDKIMFSHKIHLQEYQLKCEQCHSGIEKSKKITRAQIPTMESCLDCHKKHNGPIECSICHPDWDKPIHRSGIPAIGKESTVNGRKIKLRDVPVAIRKPRA